jgi:signal transduction histidine kinase
MTSADADPQNVSHDWRKQLLLRGLRGAGWALVFIPPLLCFLFSYSHYSYLALSFLGFGFLLLPRYVDRASKLIAYIFLGAGYLAVAAYGWDMAWAPGVVAGLCGLVVFAGLLLGRQAATAVILLTAILLVAGGTAVSLGVYTPRMVAELDPVFFRSWLRGGLVFTLLSTAAARGIHFVVHTIRRAEANAQVALAKETEEHALTESALVQKSQQEAALLEAQKLQTIAQLGDGFAHLFNNFLTTIRFATEEIRNASGSIPLAEMGQFIARNVAFAADKTRDLLLLSRPHSPETAPRDLDAALRLVQDKLAGRLRGNISLTLETRPVGIVRISDSWLEQILMNLLLNAEQAMPEGGAVHVSTKSFDFEKEHRGSIQILSPGSYAALVVSDNGRGMDANVALTACEPFFTTKGRDRHDGLGLTLVYSMVRQLGGSLEFIRLEPGTQVIVYFPVCLPENSHPPLATAHPARTSAPAPAAGSDLPRADSPAPGPQSVTAVAGLDTSPTLSAVAVPSTPDRWEDRTVDRLLKASLLATALATFGAFVALGSAHARMTIAIGGIDLAALGLGCWPKRWSLVVRKAILLGVIGATGALGMIHYSYLLPTTVVLLFLVVMLAALFTNATISAVILASTFGVFLLGGWLHQRGIVVTSFAEISPMRAHSWFRVAIMLSAMPWLVAIAVTHAFRAANARIDALAAACLQLGTAQRRRQSEFEQLTTLERMSSRAARMESIGRLTGTVAHDLNNSLQIICGWADLLRIPQNCSEEERQEAIRGIDQATDYAEALIDQLQLGTETRRAPGSVDVGAAVLGMREMMATLLSRKSGSRLEVVVADHCFVRIAEPSFRRLLLNLVSNASDAMSARSQQGCCRVSVTRTGQDVALCVEDNGSGMDADLQKRIFSAFFTTKPGTGTGLGLHSVSRIAETTQGRIEVVSQVNEGARFIVRWPKAAPPPVSVDRPERASGGTVLGRILLAEDEPAVRQMLVRGLRRGGFDVTEAQDGDHAFEELVHGSAFDALCIDAIMPGRSTASVIEEFSRLHPGRPVVLISGHLPAEFDSTTLTLKHVSFLHKPFTSATLVDEISRRMAQD